MNKFKSFLVVASVMGHAAFASLSASQVTDGRGYLIAIASHPQISQYLAGRTKATAELLFEVLKFAEEMDSRHTGLNEKATELLILAEEVAGHFPELSLEWRDKLRPILSSLLNQYPVRTKNEILMRLFDKYWLWSTDNIDYLARMIRADNSNLVSTQAIWVLDRASREERATFFTQVPEKKPNKIFRWFRQALAYRYGFPVDTRELRKLLSSANPENLKPVPKSFNVDGASISTSVDLYNDTLTRISNETTLVPSDNTCSEEFTS